MSVRLAFVNEAQIQFEREMNQWRDWIFREGRCHACEAPDARYENVDGWPLCADCAIDPQDDPPAAA